MPSNERRLEAGRQVVHPADARLRGQLIAGLSYFKSRNNNFCDYVSFGIDDALIFVDLILSALMMILPATVVASRCLVVERTASFVSNKKKIRYKRRKQMKRRKERKKFSRVVFVKETV